MKTTDKKIIHELMLVIKNMKPDINLQLIINSYNDTLDDEEILSMLQDYNDKGRAFRELR